MHLGLTGRRAGLAAAVVAIVLLGSAGPAAAHAAVISSSPAQGAHMTRAPGTVTVAFDQPVRPASGGLVVLDSGGRQVQTASVHPSPTVLRATLPGSLGSGAYVSNYTVTSVDGHVVSGAIVFLVGNASAASVAHLARPHTTLTNWVDDFGQFLVYLGVLVAAGLAFFLAFVLGDGSERGRLRRLAYVAGGVSVVGMLVTTGAQVALAGGGLSAIGHWANDTQVLDGKLGAQFGLQLLGLAACVGAISVRDALVRQFSAFYGLVVAAGAFVVFGHAIVSPERWLSIPADVVHAVFAAMWAGGIVGLVVVLRSRLRVATATGERAAAASVGGPSSRATAPVRASAGAAGRGVTSTALLEPPALGPTVRAGGEPLDGALLASTTKVVGRFSTMAGISFAFIIVAGFLLAIAEVGSVANLFETGYGQTLLVKLAVVGLLLVVAGYNRFLLLPWLFSKSEQATPTSLGLGWRRLSSTVRWEALGMIAILGVTSVLANGTPSNGATAPAPVPFHQTQAFGGGNVSLSITPNQALVNNWTVQFTGPGGAPADMAQSVALYLVLPSQNVGPIETDMQRVGVGRFTLSDSPNPPIVGSWQIVLQVQVSEFSQPDVSFADTVR